MHLNKQGLTALVVLWQNSKRQGKIRKNIQWWGWEQHLEIIYSNPPSRAGSPRAGLLRITTRWVQNLLREEDSTTCLGSPFQHLHRKEDFLHVQVELPVFWCVPIAPCPTSGHHNWHINQSHQSINYFKVFLRPFAGTKGPAFSPDDLVCHSQQRREIRKRRRSTCQRKTDSMKQSNKYQC